MPMLESAQNFCEHPPDLATSLLIAAADESHRSCWSTCPYWLQIASVACPQWVRRSRRSSAAAGIGAGPPSATWKAAPGSVPCYSAARRV